MSGYTGPFGPWNPNAPPGINNAFLNALENWVVLVDQTVPTTVSGTSGTASVYQPLRGVLKLVIITETNYRNGGGSAQTVSLPAPFTIGFRWWTGDTNTMNFVGSGTTRNVGLITSLGTSGGSRNVQTDVPSYSMGDCFNSSVDTISFNGGAGSAHNGISILLGI